MTNDEPIRLAELSEGDRAHVYIDSSPLRLITENAQYNGQDGDIDYFSVDNYRIELELVEEVTEVGHLLGHVHDEDGQQVIEGGEVVEVWKTGK
ncbi:hypothetical protein DVK00_02760 [Haloarcula sp. Atlit-47R]|uniref:hypothetical protein n=1 Tax=Haloarcula sp. Atlit-47R TaxID=2282132 RepID=UPI000EF1E94E|nr:hypothetical protein [Haloarcula sp. Atlit-47R]RLM47445.1 hypothetical protein DVK00_02760 [Haloarcula sp. Atlit-47R]